MRRPSLHGRTCSVPLNRTHPANPRQPSFCRCSGFCRCRAASPAKRATSTAPAGCCPPIPPTPDNFMRLLVGVDRWSTPLPDIAIRPHADQRSAPTTISSSIHQQQVPTDRGELSKAGWVRLRGCERHGWRDQAPMDGFTASPSTGPTPPSHGKPAFDVALASAGAGLQALQNKQTYLNRTSRLLPAHTTASHATPCQPHCASARLPNAPPAAMPMNMPVNNSALRRLRAGGTRP